MRELKFREIKFRGFDTENKTWTFVTLGDLICGACTEKGDKPLSGAKQVWEQYTGLKDKNGKEIYEGDIVRSSYKFVGDAEPTYTNHEIEWQINSLDDNMPDISVGFWLPDDDDYIEVIGNIHENPELSEKRNGKPLSWEFQNNHGHLGGVDIYAKNKELLVWVDDCYYNFCIPFDKFLEIAEKVRGMENAED